MYSFNITILGEGHPLSPGWQGPGRYFNPPSPCGEGRHRAGAYLLRHDFNPPSPCGEGPVFVPHLVDQSNFNPPSPCGEGLSQPSASSTTSCISIHPPRVGRDAEIAIIKQICLLISIHPPRVGRDTLRVGKKEMQALFQSTLPVWGGTL